MCVACLRNKMRGRRTPTHSLAAAAAVTRTGIDRVGRRRRRRADEAEEEEENSARITACVYTGTHYSYFQLSSFHERNPTIERVG